MATKSENSEIAVLQTQMSNVEQTVARIESKLDTQANAYVTKDEFLAFKKQYWMSHTITALVTAIITGLVFYFFKVRA